MAITNKSAADIAAQQVDNTPVLPAPDAVVSMTAPDGKTYNVPGSSFQEATSQGWTPDVPLQSPHEQRVASAVAHRNDNGIFAEGGTANVLADKFLNQASFGAAPIFEHHGETPEQTEIRQAQEKATEDEHPYLSGAASGLGFAGTFAVPGVGELGDLAKGAVLGRAGEEAAAKAVARLKALQALNDSYASRATSDALRENFKQIGTFLTKSQEKLTEQVSQRAATEGVVRSATHVADAELDQGVQAASKVQDINNVAKSAVESATDQEAKIGLGRQLAAEAAKGAAMGAAYSTPAAIANLAVGDPNQAAEGMLWGIGTGAFLGLGSEALSQGVSAAREGLSKLSPFLKDGLEDGLDHVGLDQAGLKVNKLKENERQSVIDLLNNNDMMNKSVSEADKKALLDKYGDAIGDHENYLDSKLDEMNKDKVIADDIHGVDLNHFADGLRAKVDAWKPGVLDAAINDGEKNTFNKLIKTIQDFSDKKAENGVVSFKDVRDLQAILRPKAGFDATQSPLNKEIQQFVSTSLGDAKKAEVESMYQSLDDNTAQAKYNDYLAQMKGYQASKILSKPKYQKTIRADFPLPSALNQHESITSGVVGLVTGHPLAAAGAIAAHLARPILGHLIKRYALPIIAGGLRKAITETPEIAGALIGKSVNEGVASKLSKVGSYLTDNSMRIAARSAVAADPFKSFLGEHANGLSKDQQYQRVEYSLNDAVANPTKYAESIGAIQSVFGSHPELQQLVMQKNAAAISYLQSQLPKDPTAGQTFSKHDWKPTAKQKRDFGKILAVVEDPMVALDHVASGTLTIKERDAFAAVYPSIYNSVCGEIIKAASGMESYKIPNEIQISASIAVNKPLLKSLEPQRAAITQGNFTQAPPEQEPNGSSPSPKHTNRDMKGESGNRYMTGVQRLQNK